MDLYQELKNEKFQRISPKRYAAELKEKFRNNPALWRERILPAEKVDELIKATNGDYSEIWDNYCQLCFKPINKHTTEDCYLSEDELSWVCASCFQELQK